jgi:hypothetical protein
MAIAENAVGLADGKPYIADDYAAARDGSRNAFITALFPRIPTSGTPGIAAPV